MNLDGCIFCNIITKKIPSNIIYNDQNIIAFDNIYPVTLIHFLIVPKQHIETLADCNEEEHNVLLGKMSILAPKLANKQGCYYKIDKTGKKLGGFKVLFNVGPDAGQEIYHLHMHVMSNKKS